MNRTLLLFVILFCYQCVNANLGAVDAAAQPAAPDYSLQKNWSALPFRADAADKLPKGEEWIDDSLKAVI